MEYGLRDSGIISRRVLKMECLLQCCLSLCLTPSLINIKPPLYMARDAYMCSQGQHAQPVKDTFFCVSISHSHTASTGTAGSVAIHTVLVSWLVVAVSVSAREDSLEGLFGINAPLQEQRLKTHWDSHEYTQSECILPWQRRFRAPLPWASRIGGKVWHHWCMNGNFKSQSGKSRAISFPPAVVPNSLNFCCFVNAFSINIEAAINNILWVKWVLNSSLFQQQSVSVWSVIHAPPPPAHAIKERRHFLASLVHFIQSG